MNPAKTESARLLLRETNVMISLPEICMRLREVLDNPEHSRKDVADVLRYDPAMTARLLRIVNCAYYALPYRVHSISQALGIIGEAELKNLVLVTSIMNMSKDMDSRMNIVQFWRTSVYAAVLARNLCPGDLYPVREELFLTGLLLNVGKLLLYAKEPTLAAEVAAEMEQKKMPETDAEYLLTGTDHCVVGSLLAANWNFPESLSVLIAGHHQDSSTEELHRERTIAGLAGYFSDILDNSAAPPGKGSSGEIRNCPFEFTKLKLSEDSLQQVLEDAHTEYQEVYEVFCGEMH